MEFAHYDRTKKRRSQLTNRTMNITQLMSTSAVDQELPLGRWLDTLCHKRETLEEMETKYSMTPKAIDQRTRVQALAQQTSDLEKAKRGGCEHPGCMIKYDPDDRAVQSIHEWDHIDPSQKIAGVATMMSAQRSAEEILAEIRKCRLLCRAHHRLKTVTNKEARGRYPKIKLPNRRKRPVMQIDAKTNQPIAGAQWESIQATAKALGIHVWKVRERIISQTVIDGHRWRYVEPSLALSSQRKRKRQDTDPATTAPASQLQDEDTTPFKRARPDHSNVFASIRHRAPMSLPDDHAFPRHGLDVFASIRCRAPVSLPHAFEVSFNSFDSFLRF
jgi:hypothetical protein